MNLLNTSMMNVLEKSLDATTLRHNVIVNNVANVDTPGFKRSSVSFEDELRLHLDPSSHSKLEGYRTNDKHFEIGTVSLERLQAKSVKHDDTIMNNNKNNVDVDYEMSLLAKNQLKYNALIQQMTQQLKELRTAIGGR